jgi:flagellar biosynthesis/type III secretory pathway chaperone
MALAEISNILWSERQLLELLSFKLEEEQLLLASGRSRWLAHATREVEMVLDEIKNAELTRALQLSEVGAELGLGPQPSLRDLAAAVEAPWQTIFEQHRMAFLTAVHEIHAMAQLNRELLSRGQRATQEALAWLSERTGESELYSPSGVAQAAHNSPHFVNEAL